MSKRRSLEGPSQKQKKRQDDQMDADMSDGDEEFLEHDDLYEEEIPDEVIMPDNDGMEDTDGANQTRARVWRAGIDPIAEDEVLDYDPSAYTCYHKLNVEWPCLSIDILRDTLGNYRTKFPAAFYAVTGSQADVAGQNKVSVLKVSNLHRIKVLDDDGYEVEEEDDDVEQDPIIDARSFKHQGGINRIRAMPQRPNIVSTWADTGKVHIFNIDQHTRSLDFPNEQAPMDLEPLMTFSGHADEGYAMDWSPVSEGRLLTGGCDKQIFSWNMDAAGVFSVSNTPFNTHTGSVEDVQWSPSEKTVFSSASTDGTIKVWDIRNPHGKHQVSINAHSSDVNVISWNRKVNYLLASGSDDGSLKVWDLRALSAPVALFEWHKKPITSLQWHTQEDSVLVCSSEDDTVSVWDMALEADADEVAREATGADIADYNVPPQLLFVHQGQKHIKEVHFHPQIPSLILSTASDGIDIFKPSNMDVLLPPAAPTDAQADGVCVD